MRRIAAGLLVAAVVAAGCTGDDDGDGARPAEVSSAVAGRIDEDALVTGEEWDAATLEYVTWATEQGFDAGSPKSIMAHVERARRDPDYDFDATVATPDDFGETWEKLETFEDTGDFDINDLLFLWYGYRDDLSPELRDEIEDHLLSFKYWWTEPTPDGVIDSQYYWTENHQIIFAADEYIAGQAFPDETFTNSGMTGEEHMVHAEENIRRWLDLRARFGFSEWLSNVYYMEDLMGLLLLAEFSEDEEIATLASMMLDVIFVEIASHTQAGSFGATHGRSYMKDKMTALSEDNFNLSKLLFDDTTQSFQGLDKAVLVARAERYRVPEVARRIAKVDDVGVVQQHQSLPLDPTVPIEDDPEAPYGFDFEDPENLMVWWGIGGQFPWQMVPVTVETMAEYDLWSADNFRRADQLRPIVESSTIEALQELALSLSRQLNAGLLSEVSTTTWRAPEVMLSTAQCWRPGQRGEQNHSWQATLDAEALVFTNHPRHPVPSAEDPNENEGYWTGDGAMPCSVQVDNVGISVYEPGYASSNDIGDFDYLDLTHAFFPTERFDEVVEQDGWVIGRKGDGYVALWSFRPTEWREYASGEHTLDLTGRFDLMASGGPDNVWVVEVGRAEDWATDDPAGPFEAFVDGVTAAGVEVIRLRESSSVCWPGVACEGSEQPGYEVSYDSPSQGLISLVFEGDDLGSLTAEGEEVDLSVEPRWASPWAEAAWDDGRYVADLDGYRLELDFDTATRVVTTR